VSSPSFSWGPQRPCRSRPNLLVLDYFSGTVFSTITTLDSLYWGTSFHRVSFRRVSNFVCFGIPGAVPQVSGDASGHICTERDPQFLSMDGPQRATLALSKSGGRILTPEVKSEETRQDLIHGLEENAITRECQGGLRLKLSRHGAHSIYETRSNNRCIERKGL
jgi:hypothetical protein